MNDPGPATPAALGRLASLDTYRGFVMFLMVGEILHFCEVAEAWPRSAVSAFLCHHQSHVAWVGASLHDLIQPSFSFLVGVALPFSLASRSAAGRPRSRLVAHAFQRALVLVLLGIGLRLLGNLHRGVTFEDTLTQIGLGYGLLFLIGLRPRREQWLALAFLLASYWAAFAVYPAPGAAFDWAAVGVPAEWPHHPAGFAAHWDKNSNLASAFDTWLLNLFPRETPFRFNEGGYATLSFIPTLGTMVLGLLAGGVLRSDRTAAARVRWLVVAGAISLAAGWLLGALGWCPVVKRIWTPSFTLWSGGLCLWFLAAFYHAIDVRGHRRWTFPFVVVGMNSIAAYVLDEVLLEIVDRDLLPHVLGSFDAEHHAWVLLLQGAAVLTLLWGILFLMYKRRVFLRI